MENLYSCDRSLELVVEGAIGNGHSGYIKVIRPGRVSAKEKLKSSLGLAGPLVDTAVVVLANVNPRNAKEATLTVDLFQLEAGARVRQKSFTETRPTDGTKEITLRMRVDLF